MSMRAYAILITGLFSLLFALGCRTIDVRTEPEPRYEARPAPPPHAPAHGYRKKYAYRYYPSSHVYYDTGRRLYFYLQSGEWKVGAHLPGFVNIDLNESVSIEMGTDKPYLEFESHKAKYPPKPGGKKKIKDPGKAKGKEK